MEMIDTSKMIFVFGSNEAGRHGAGAAKYAHLHMGAIYGCLDFAERTPVVNYQVTCIGCGLGGKTHADIAPMFVSAPSNCYFDLLWEKWLPGKQFWGTF